MDSEVNKIRESVRQELANFLGVDLEDIVEESSLEIDLHMKASDLTDFMEILNRMNIQTSGVDLSEIETFSELVEALTTHE